MSFLFYWEFPEFMTKLTKIMYLLIFFRHLKTTSIKSSNINQSVSPFKLNSLLVMSCYLIIKSYITIKNWETRIAMPLLLLWGYFQVHQNAHRFEIWKK